MTALPTEPTYLWVVIPTGVAGVAPNLAEAWATVESAMDQQADAQAWAILEVQNLLQHLICRCSC